MKTVVVLIFSWVTFSGLFAQEPPQEFLDRASFCDSNLLPSQVEQLRQDLDSLEDYFIQAGLLANRSGASYWSVYEKIAKENELIFKLEKKFEVLDSLDFEVLGRCYYKVLSSDQLAEVTPRHYRAAEMIGAEYSGNLGPGLVARRILDHLSPEDFDLEYYRVSSLLTFYQIATPAEESLVEWFDSTEKKDLPVEVVSVYLDQENSIYVNATRVSTSEGEKIIYQILKRNPTQTVIEVTVAREALYDSFLQCREMIDAVYSKIESELGVVPKRIRYLEKSGPCQLDESP